MLTKAQEQNASLLKQDMIAKGITNPFVQTAILGVIYKESGFNPSASEVSYSNTSSKRIKDIFGNAKKLSDAEIDSLKKDNVRFYNVMYNGVVGNGANDGYKYRGRGYNQLTGRANYKSYGDLVGIDLVNNPDSLATHKVASDVALGFFKKGVDSAIRSGKFSKYNVKTINDFQNQKDAYNAIYHVNAGIGKNLYDDKGNIIKDITGGYTKGEKALDYLKNSIIGTVKETTKKAVEYTKENPLPVVITGLLFGATLFFLIYKRKQIIKFFNTTI